MRKILITIIALFTFSIGYGQCTANFSFTYSNTSDSIEFTNSSTGNSLYYFWDFGDGTSSTIKNPKHFYSGVPSSRTIRLWVYDSMSFCVDSSSKVFNAGDSITRDCKADFTFSQPDSNTREIHFTKSLDPYSSFNFDFGVPREGPKNYSNQNKASHTYFYADTFTVCLNTYNKGRQNCKDTMCKKIFVKRNSDSNCRADFDAAVYRLGSWSSYLSLPSTSDGLRLQYEWSVGSSEDSNNSYVHAVFNLTFDTTYVITLKITDPINGCTDSITKSIYIKPKACRIKDIAMYHVEPPGIGASIWIIKNSLDTTNKIYQIDKGDGSPVYTSSHLEVYPGDTLQYTNYGDYTFCIFSEDTITGCRDTFCRKVLYIDPDIDECEIDFTSTPLLNRRIQLQPQLTGSYQSLTWDWNNHSFTTDSTPILGPLVSGTYEVMLTAIDSIRHCKISITKEVVIPVGNPLNACTIDIETKVIRRSCTININNYDSLNHLRYDDGTNTIRRDSVTKLSTPRKKKYTIKAGAICNNGIPIVKSIDYEILYDDCNYSYTFAIIDSTKQMEIGIVPNKAFLSNPQIIVHWYFGDGTTTNHFTSHTYTDTGVYIICMNVVDPQSRCESSYCDTLHIDSLGVNDSITIRRIIRKHVGINDTKKEISTIYPNPFTSNITIDAQDNAKGEILISDTYGVLLKTYNLEGKNTHNLDLSSLASGVYFLQVNTEKGTDTQKIIKK